MAVVELCGVFYNLSIIWHDVMPRDMLEHVLKPGRPVQPPVDPILANKVVINYDRIPR